MEDDDFIDWLIDREECIMDLDDVKEINNLKEISKRFNNGTETMEDIMNYCINYEIKFENGLKLRVVEKRYFDKLVERIKELEEESESKEKAYNNCYFEYKQYKQFESIPVQKVKDKIEELKKDYEDSKDENGETEYYYSDYTIRKLEELLEDK